MNSVARFPVVASEVECIVQRRLIDPEVQVTATQLVEPQTVIALAAGGVERVARIAVAVELGIPPTDVPRRLVRPLGDRVEAGEVVAKRWRGLQSVQVTSPLAGRLAALDERNGTLTVVAEAPRRPVPALVAGEVVRTTEERVEIRTVGDLVAGAVLLGPESAGPLVVLADRADRELPLEAFDERCRDAIVVAGMTVSSAALRRLSELGVAGVIVGGLPVRALEPFFGTALLPWLRSLPHDSVTGWPLPFGVVMLEGFGRIPIAEAVFSIFRERAGRWTTLLRGESVGIDRPVCFMSSRGQRGRPLEPVPLCDGGLVHLRIPARPGIGRLCRLPFLARSPEGFAFEAVLVERDDRIEVVPVELVDPLELPS